MKRLQKLKEVNLEEVGELNDAKRLYYAEVKLGRSLSDTEKQATLYKHLK